MRTPLSCELLGLNMKLSLLPLACKGARQQGLKWRWTWPESERQGGLLISFLLSSSSWLLPSLLLPLRTTLAGWLISAFDGRSGCETVLRQTSNGLRGQLSATMVEG